MSIIYFFIWTFVLYWIHRIGHRVSFIKQYHLDHHGFILKNGNPGWSWNNLFLFNDTWLSTIDLWITEVIPTLVFSWLTDQWWIFTFYYIWAALVQEVIEHNTNFNMPLLTSGKWHVLHHYQPNKNFSLFFPLWDILFGTHAHVD